MSMPELLDIIIIGLFAVFCIYFVYTLVDTLYLSKRKRKAKMHPPAKKEKTDTGESDDSKRDEAAEDSDDAPEKEKRHDDDKDEKSTPKKQRRSLRSLMPSFSLRRSAKTKKRLHDKLKVDDEYFDLLREFFIKTNGSWTKDAFYSFFSDMVRKGYDKRPSELVEDLEVVRKQIDEERKLRSEANLSSKTPSDVKDEVEEDVEEDVKEKSANDDEAKKDDSPASPTEEDLKEAEKQIEKRMRDEKKDTRQELDKTLKEIREIRERLSKFE